MKLHEMAKLIRAKNAGPFMLTIDILFETDELYEKAKSSGVLTKETVAKQYGIPVDEVFEYFSPKAKAIKYSFKRPYLAGAYGDIDIYGGQYHSPLVMLEIPD